MILLLNPTLKEPPSDDSSDSHNLVKQPYLGNDPQLRFIDSMLLVDEADNIMKFNFDVLRQILENVKALDVHQCLFKTLDVPGRFMKATPFYEVVGGNP